MWRGTRELPSKQGVGGDGGDGVVGLGRGEREVFSVPGLHDSGLFDSGKFKARPVGSAAHIRTGSSMRAYAAAGNLRRPTVIAFSALIDACAALSPDCLLLYLRMLRLGVPPNAFSFSSLFKSASGPHTATPSSFASPTIPTSAPPC